MSPIDRPAAADAPTARRTRVRTPLPESFTHRLHTLQKLTDKVTQDAYLAATGLPLGEGRCLSAVGAFAPLSVKDLAQRANVDKAQASRAAQALVDKGLVEKSASSADARGVVLRFTPEGQRLWRRLMAVIEARNQQIVACLSDTERAQFDRILTRLVDHARDVAQQGG